ncbi:hypothetical protein [Pseudomonas sp.]|uniref:phage tail tape measure protein n=1 Tax=Pseudomonas sp. TaxID=306 RepID=UPI003F38628A
MAIAKLSIDIEARLANFEQQMEKVAKQAEGLAGRVKSSFSTLGMTVGGVIGGLVSAEAVGRFKGLVDSLDQLDEAAERLGMSAESLSALDFAGKMNGVEFEDMTTALTKLSVKMQEAASGGKEAGALFADIGVKVVDSAGKLKPVEKVFAEIAERFAGFKDGAGKTALAVDLLGKSGAKLVPVLNGGADGLERMRKELETLGGVVDGKLSKQAADLNDNLDRLSVLSGAVGKNIAGGLLPWLNKLATEFLVAQSAGLGFFDMLYARSSSAGDNHIDKLERATQELEKLKAERSRRVADIPRTGSYYADIPSIDADIARAQRLVSYHKNIKEAQERADAPPPDKQKTGGGTEITRTGTGGGKKKHETAEATAEATAYGKAMESLAKVSGDANASTLDLNKSQAALYDLMTSAEWQTMPDAWKKTAVAQFEQAYAAEQSAAATAQLNRLLGETKSSKIEVARDDMLALTKALEECVISEEKYLEAVQARLGLGSEEIQKQKSLVEELGLTFSSAFEDAVAGGKQFGDVLKGLEQDILRLLTRLAVTEPLGKAVQGFDWGGLASAAVGLFSGGTGTASAGPSAAAGGGSWLGTGQRFALGGVFEKSPSLSAFSGGVFDSPQFFRFAAGAGVFGEAGPEAIMPLKRGRDGKLGVAAESGGGNVTVNVINNTDAQARSEKRSDGSGGTIIDVFIEQAKNAVAGDIARGSGAVPAALQGAYGLKRAAGAY